MPIEAFSDLGSLEANGEVLYILDEYDQLVVSESKESLRALVGIFLAQSHWILFSRSGGYSPASFDPYQPRVLKIIGLPKKGILEFVQNCCSMLGTFDDEYYSPGIEEGIMKMLQAHEGVREIARLPFILELLCLNYRNRNLKMPLTVTSVYRNAEDAFVERSRRDKKKHNPDIFSQIGKLAWRGIDEGITNYSPEVLQEFFKTEHKAAVTFITRVGLFESADLQLDKVPTGSEEMTTYKFTHHTYAEYYAARYLAKFIVKDDKKEEKIEGHQNWRACVKSCRAHKRFFNVLSFVAGILVANTQKKRELDDFFKILWGRRALVVNSLRENKRILTARCLEEAEGNIPDITQRFKEFLIGKQLYPPRKAEQVQNLLEDALCCTPINTEKIQRQLEETKFCTPQETSEILSFLEEARRPKPSNKKQIQEFLKNKIRKAYRQSSPEKNDHWHYLRECQLIFDTPEMRAFFTSEYKRNGDRLIDALVKLQLHPLVINAILVEKLQSDRES